MSELRPVDGAEIHAQPKPPDEMVWAICPWIQMHARGEQCKHCPEWQKASDLIPGEPDDEIVQQGCYAMAEEACRVVFAIQARKP